MIGWTPVTLSSDEAGGWQWWMRVKNQCVVNQEAGGLGSAQAFVLSGDLPSQGNPQWPEDLPLGPPMDTVTGLSPPS